MPHSWTQLLSYTFVWPQKTKITSGQGSLTPPLLFSPRLLNSCCFLAHLMVFVYTQLKVKKTVWRPRNQVFCVTEAPFHSSLHLSPIPIWVALLIYSLSFLIKTGKISIAALHISSCPSSLTGKQARADLAVAASGHEVST